MSLKVATTVALIGFLLARMILLTIQFSLPNTYGLTGETVRSLYSFSLLIETIALSTFFVTLLRRQRES
jgi:hypothetical protein